jgi:hypothetical protein
MLKYSSISHFYVLYMHEMLPVGGSERERERERKRDYIHRNTHHVEERIYSKPNWMAHGKA